MNILQKFLDIYKQFIIVVSGFEKLHLSDYAQQLAGDLNFELIEFKYPDFESLNKEVNNTKKNGVIIYGLTFPTDKLEFKPNYHISLSGNKTLIDDDNKFTIYNENVKENFVNKFKNLKLQDYNDETYDDIYNMIIDHIMKKVYGNNYEKAQQKYLEDSEASSDNEENNNTEMESDSASETESKSSTELSGGKKKKAVKGNRKMDKKKASKKREKVKKIKRIIGTRLLMRVIKIKN
jgi:hypothetical protein